MNLQRITIENLKQICRNNNISGYSVNKDKIINLINENITDSIKTECEKLESKKPKSKKVNNPYKAKEIEDEVILLLNGGSSETIYPDSTKIYNHIKSISSEKIKKSYKPKNSDNPVTDPKYTTGSEPKTDIVIIYENGDKKCFSIKKNDTAYLISINSPSDFIAVFIDIYNGRDILDSTTISNLEKCSALIKKSPNFYSYDKSYSKTNNISGFIKDKFYSKAVKYVGEENATTYSNFIEKCYNDTTLRNEYKNNLHTNEPFIRKTINSLFTDYPEYSKKVLFEIITGKIKFDNNECSCDYIVVNHGIFTLDDYNCDYVNTSYNKFLNTPKLVRLQNVPRKCITKKVLESKDSQQIANDFSVADFTFKL